MPLATIERPSKTRSDCDRHTCHSTPFADHLFFYARFNIRKNNYCMCGSRGGQGVRTPPPLKNHKNTGFSSNTGPDPLKNRSYQPSIQCWAIIAPPAKRHLNGWRANDGPFIAVFRSSIPSSTKKKTQKNVIKFGPPLTKLSGSAHVPYCRDEDFSV